MPARYHADGMDDSRKTLIAGLLGILVAVLTVLWEIGLL